MNVINSSTGIRHIVKEANAKGNEVESVCYCGFRHTSKNGPYEITGHDATVLYWTCVRCVLLYRYYEKKGQHEVEGV